jgi:DcmR-like sensory protein
MLTSMPESRRERIHTHRHAVQFYGSDDSLFSTVAGFLSEGLVAGQPALLIATAPHRAAIIEQLTGRLVDVAAAQGRGELVLLDAHETLSTFMTADAPDAELFEREIGGVIERTLHGRARTVLRAYGEMVDVLWKEGRTEAAIKLEILWNKLALKYSFSLMCGYAMGNFFKKAEQYQEVCRQHTHVLEPEPNVVAFQPKRNVKSA